MHHPTTTQTKVQASTSAKNDVYTLLSQLVEGDRFHFQNDKKKRVYEVLYHTKRKQKGFLKAFTICKDADEVMNTFLSERHVLFLNNSKAVVAAAPKFIQQSIF